MRTYGDWDKRRCEFCAGDLRSATKRRKTGDPAQSPKDGRKSKVLAKQAGVPDSGFPPLSGCSRWVLKGVPYKIKRTLFRGAVCGGLPHGPHCTSPPRPRLPSTAEMLGEKALRPHARHGLLGRTRPHKDTQFSPSVEKVAVGASCIRALCTKAQMAPEH